MQLANESFFLLFAQDCRGMQNSTHARVQFDAIESRAPRDLIVILIFRNSECPIFDAM